jgi:DNA repair ATPase RecN
MTYAPTRRTAQWGCLALFFLAMTQAARAADDVPVTREQFLLLQQQNRQMQQQPEKQQQLIDSLTRKVSEIQQAQPAPGQTPPAANNEAEAP